MKKIALIYMGGTFGCVGEPLAPMPYIQFMPQLQRIIPIELHVDCFSAPAIKDSSACTAPDWLMLAQQIQQLQLQGYAHFVVIHGTDTLSYAAATLARFLGQSCHLIITGSQYLYSTKLEQIPVNLLMHWIIYITHLIKSLSYPQEVIWHFIIRFSMHKPR